VPDYTVVEQARRAQALYEPLPLARTNPVVRLKPYWTDFRGPRRNGIYEERPILTEWPINGLPRLWRIPCGGGYASFVVARGLAVTIEQRRDHEAVVAYDLDTGREVWAASYPAHFTEWMGGDGPRATPTCFEDFIYSLGAAGDLRCLSLDRGTVLWEKNVLADTGAENLHYGLACSPIMAGRNIVVLSGQGAQNQAVVAYDFLTGERRWAALSDTMAYTSPALVELAGRPQLLLVTARRALGLDLETHQVLWDHPWQVQYDNAIAMPVVVSTNRFLLSAGYGTGAALVEIRPDGAGFRAAEIWRNRNLKNKFNASVFWQGHLYGLDEGVLCCVNALTGERIWREGRYGYGQILLAEGHLFVLSGDGDLALVPATPSGFVQKHRVKALSGKTWNVPAFAHGRLLVRNSTEMTCFDLRRRRNDDPATW
jgi:outer membrane protein assembly factor BamB